MAVILPSCGRRRGCKRGVADLDLAAVNLAEGNSAEVIGVIQVRHEHLETVAGLRARRRDMFDDGLEQRFHRAAGVLDVDLGVAVLGAGIDHREIQLLIGGVQGNEKIKHQVQHLVRLDFRGRSC